MALKKRFTLWAILVMVLGGARAEPPFETGASMANFNALHGDDISNTQAWESAVFPIVKKGAGLGLSGVRYYDIMDNTNAFSLSQVAAGGWFANPAFRCKVSGSFFNAYNIYAEAGGFFSAAYQVLPVVAVSVEGRGQLKYLMRASSSMQSLSFVGFSGVVTFPYALGWLSVQNITIEDASAVGFSAPLTLRVGVCNHNNRFGTQGLVLESSSRPNSIRLSVAEHYWFCKQAGLTIALTTNPSMIGAGFTLALPAYAAVVALTHHPLLGWSQGVMLAKSFELTP